MADRVAAQSTGIFQSLYDGIFKGDFSENDSTTKVAAQIGVGLVPIVGQVADARDTAAALKDVRSGATGGWDRLAFSLVGWIPALGDFAKAVHRSGVKKTLGAIGDSFDSIKETWKVVAEYGEEKLGQFGTFFYKPAENLKARGLSPGTYGVTNRWGDIDINKRLKPEVAKTTLDHERVHQFFSPKFKYGQELRANLGVLGYAESHLIRRVEEGLAEAWAQWKAKGWSGIVDGWQFPYRYDYNVNPERVKVERNLLLGVTSTAAGTGAALAASHDE